LKGFQNDEEIDRFEDFVGQVLHQQHNRLLLVWITTAIDVA
jgi:hypothetical protein